MILRTSLLKKIVERGVELSAEGPDHGLRIADGWVQPTDGKKMSPFGAVFSLRMPAVRTNPRDEDRVLREGIRYLDQHLGGRVPVEPGSADITALSFPVLGFYLGMSPEDLCAYMHGFWRGCYLWQKPWKREIEETVLFAAGKQLYMEMHTVR